MYFRPCIGCFVFLGTPFITIGSGAHLVEDVLIGWATKKKTLTFHHTACLLGILLMVYEIIPTYNWVVTIPYASLPSLPNTLWDRCLDPQTPPEKKAFRGSFHTSWEGMTGGFWKTRAISINQARYQSTNQGINQPTKVSINQPRYQSTNQGINQPTKVSINQPRYQSTNQGINQPTKVSINQPRYQSTNQGINQPTKVSINQPRLPLDVQWLK